MYKKQKQKAFTLVEILFVTVILGIVGIALTSFMIFSARSMSWSIRKSMVTSDFRKFTGQITQDAINSNTIFLYNSFNPGDVTPAGQRSRGLSGDCLVFVSYEPIPAINSPRFYQEVIVYNRDAAGSVFRREFTYPNPNILQTDSNIETIINALRGQFSTPRLVIEETVGNINNQFFYRVNETTFMVHGNVIHGNINQEITNTYNLTISTGG